MRLADSAGANKQHIVVAPQKCPLCQLQKPDLGDTRDQRKIKVLQPFLIGKGRGFETLAQLLLASVSQFPDPAALASSPGTPIRAAPLRGPAPRNPSPSALAAIA